MCTCLHMSTLVIAFLGLAYLPAGAVAATPATNAPAVDTDITIRFNIGSGPHDGSYSTFRVFYHFFSETVLVATIPGTLAGTVFNF
ncbi:hypothetical protein DIPPA_54873, partial [Diplonema papillatum]